MHGQKKHYDIAYFRGPRLQAVGIATDEESHFHGNREWSEKWKVSLLVLPQIKLNKIDKYNKKAKGQ